MRKAALLMLLVPLLFLGASSFSGPFEKLAYAQPRGGHGGGGGHYRGGGGGGGHGAGGRVGHGGGYYRGGGGHGHGGHGGHFSGSLFIGGGPWFWDPFYYPFYPYYAYPYYQSSPTVIIEQKEPEDYIMVPQQEQKNYWYYCKESGGYYPNVKRCPGGWMKVVPAPPSDQGPEDQED